MEDDYNLGRWHEVLARKDWLHASTFESYLFDRGTKQIVAKLDNKIVKIRPDVYYRWRAEKLQMLLDLYSETPEQIVELGCGYGYNIFTLVISNRYKHLRGFDISVNAIHTAKEIAQHFGVENVEFELMDLRNSGDPNFRHIKDETVFTYYCLEQLPYDTELILNNILEGRPRRVIHIEPTTELLNPLRPLDLVSYLYMLSMCYQRKLVGAINSMAKAGKVRIVEITRANYAPSIRNDPTVIVWEPV